MLGKIVLYRMPAALCGWRDQAGPDGCKAGNQNSPGDLAPAIITRVWPNEFQGENGGRVDGYNVTVFPDGRTPLWATSVKFGDGEGQLRPMEA